MVHRPHYRMDLCEAIDFERLKIPVIRIEKRIVENKLFKWT